MWCMVYWLGCVRARARGARRAGPRQAARVRGARVRAPRGFRPAARARVELPPGVHGTIARASPRAERGCWRAPPPPPPPPRGGMGRGLL
ncbi:MAG: hypothetical protein J3K34DRAFT_427475 [Monoraphidium minutum]|nr:MAG: hypothetical protein J3K34DRAFT_427475 [Monoraphidium minutum]